MMPDTNGNGEPDLSPSAVNARLAAFVAEHREGQARGDTTPAETTRTEADRHRG
jgi:hypothetical protein